VCLVLRYNIVNMTPWESAVWAIGSIANIMCFILAWVYVFDSIQLEIKELDDAQEVRDRPQTACSTPCCFVCQ